MRYYPCTVNLDNFHNKLSGYHFSVRKEQRLLTSYGYYKYIKDELYKFKICMDEDNSFCKKKYINNIDFKITKKHWIKVEKEYSLPIDNAILPLEIYIFSPHPKSKTKFIIEKWDGKVHDYYFTSKEEFDNHSLKEDITSFLSLLN